MKTEHLKRAIEIFDQAADLTPSACARHVNQMCGADIELRTLVEEMLACDERRRLGKPIASDAVMLPDRPPVRIGNYEIVALIGEGGMVTVYEARQDRPRRAVALKVLRTSLATRELLAR